MKIWLDDNCENPDSNRLTPDGWIGVKNFQEFKAVVERAHTNGEHIEAFDFDNDLGAASDGTVEMEGRDILRWLKENYPEYVVGEGIELRTHSSNPAANERMRQDITYWRSHKEEVLAEKERPSPWDSLSETEIHNKK